MKKVLYTGACLALLALGACNKDLTQVPPSSTTTANFYGNTSDFTQALTGAYSKLRNYPDAAIWMGEMRSDNVRSLPRMVTAISRASTTFRPTLPTPVLW